MAREIVGGRAGLDAPITDMREALITTAYSLGGAAIALGITWLVLPQGYSRGLRWSAALWLGATALLLGAHRVSGCE